MDLSEKEQQVYGELFQTCNSDGSGRISSMKAMDFLITSGIHQDILSQIHELCAQCGLPLKLESLNSGKEMPLPQFTKSNEQGEFPIILLQIRSNLQCAGQLPPPPKKSHTRSLSGHNRSESLQQYSSQSMTNSREETSPMDSKSPQFSPKQSPPSSPAVITVMPNLVPTPVSPGAGGGGSNVPPPQTAGHVGTGAYVNPGLTTDWLSFEDEEHHGLLGTGPKKAYEAVEPVGVDSSSMSSDPESVDDVWTITDEQRMYYMNQFKTMQPDLSGVIVGSVAKEFFEKSKLPLKELSKIWQLSDLNRDGALSVEEFCIAMHLVVLRRYDIELPDHLPFSLMPYATLTNDEPFAADLAPGSTLRRLSPSDTPPAVNQPSSQSLPVSQAQWIAEFNQESQAAASDVLSPPMKPVNFEFQTPVAVDPDSKIIHPVPMRVAQDNPPVSGERFDRGRAFSDPSSIEASELPTSPSFAGKPRSNTEFFPDNSQNDISSTNKISNVPLHGRPRPVSLKYKPVPGVTGPLLIPLSITSQGFESGDKPPFTIVDSVQGPEPPVPPPRQHQHVRRWSEELKGLHPPPAVPPRMSPKEGPSPRKALEGGMFADFKAFPSHDESNEIVSEAESQMPNTDNADGLVIPSADVKKATETSETADTATEEVFTQSTDLVKLSTNIQERLEGAENVEEELDSVEQPKPQTVSFPVSYTSKDKRDLQMRLRTHRERNSALMRLNSELNQELQEVMEQRIALEINLEHLRPFSM
ncbi:hypothetical protein ScPMuIL_013146 [Solemya velum]